MSDLRCVSREFLTEFIELYQQFPCLWQVKSKDYSDRNMKNAAYEHLILKLKEVDKNATKETVIKKINTIRGCFRKEYKKVQSSLKSGKGTDDVYHPSLWYYHLLLFVMGQDMPRNSVSNLNTEVDDELYYNESEGDDGDEISASVEQPGASPLSEAEQAQSPLSRPRHTSEEPSSRTSSLRPSSRSSFVNPPRKRVQSYSNTTADELLTTISRKLEAGEKPSDEFDAVGRNIACKLRRVSETSPRTRVFAEKLINDVLYYAELGYLNENSRFVVNHHNKPQPNISVAPQFPHDRLLPPSHIPGERVAPSLTPLMPYTAPDANTTNVRTYVHNFLTPYDSFNGYNTESGTSISLALAIS